MNTGLAAVLAALAIGGVLAAGLSLEGGDGNSGIPSGAILQDVDTGPEDVEETGAGESSGPENGSDNEASEGGSNEASSGDGGGGNEASSGDGGGGNEASSGDGGGGNGASSGDGGGGNGASAGEASGSGGDGGGGDGGGGDGGGGAGGGGDGGGGDGGGAADGAQADPGASATNICRVVGEIDGDDFDIDSWTSCGITFIETFLQVRWIRPGVTVGLDIGNFSGNPGDYTGVVTLIGAPNEDSFYGGECTVTILEFDANGGQTLRASATDCNDIPTIAENVEVSLFLIEP